MPASLNAEIGELFLSFQSHPGGSPVPGRWVNGGVRAARSWGSGKRQRPSGWEDVIPIHPDGAVLPADAATQAASGDEKSDAKRRSALEMKASIHRSRCLLAPDIPKLRMWGKELQSGEWNLGGLPPDGQKGSPAGIGGPLLGSAESEDGPADAGDSGKVDDEARWENTISNERIDGAEIAGEMVCRQESDAG